MTLFVVRLTMGLLSGRMTFRQNTLHVSPGFWNTKIQGNFFFYRLQDAKGRHAIMSMAF